MARFPLTDAETELLVCGGVPPGRDELVPLAAMFASLRERVRRSQPVAMSPRLAAELRDPPVVARTSASLLRRGVAWAAAAAVAAIALVGVGARENVLPADVQDAVSSAAAVLGIDVPTAATREGVTDDDRPSGSRGRPSESAPPAGAATPADPGSPGDQQPATPAVPPEHSSGGNPEGTGQTTDPGANAEAVQPAGPNGPESDKKVTEPDVETTTTAAHGNGGGSGGPPAGEPGDGNGGNAADKAGKTAPDGDGDGDGG